MPLDATSLAAGNGIGIKNVQFAVSVLNLPRKNLIIATYDPAITTIVDDVPVQVTSPEMVGAGYGQGFMAHRLALKTFAGNGGGETWLVPQAETGGAVKAVGEILFGGTGILAGTLSMYIAGDRVPVVVPAASTPAQVATAVVAAVTADVTLPVTAAVNGVTPEKVDFEAKSAGPWGNDISCTFNWGFGEELPANLTAVVTAMSTGAGIPDIDDALDGTGTGDAANEDWFTEVVHGYGLDSATITKVATYVGEGNDFVGLYKKIVSRPFRSLNGDVTADTAGLTAALAFADARKLDRADGVICVPGSPNHPAEIAALALGIMAKTNQNRAAESYIGKILTGIIPGAIADRWTSEYDNRDIAVKGGVSPTYVRNGAVIMQNVVSFYRPDTVPVDSNSYRSMRNISIIQNIANSIRTNFQQEKWEGVSIVQDLTRVSNPTDREKTRDVDSVIDDYVSLAFGWEDKAWIYTADYTVEQLAVANAVVIRAGGTGFDATVKVILSGEGGIIDTRVEVDTSLSVLL